MTDSTQTTDAEHSPPLRMPTGKHKKGLMYEFVMLNMHSEQSLRIMHEARNEP